ncbi:DNA repair protein rad52 [Puccinia graminis f. sp. tritici]|uniref:DNA repair protein rad52 n=1 Tax=Puccinia graminis f. sp. tritici TaxID=56615 RepID=A0A5B0SKW2_PUCGR|nr:DNA repair protein rad52 [Puccinia graminis f. sp. tritici]
MSSHLDSKPGAHHQNVKQEPIAGSSRSTGHPNREPSELQSILSKQLGPEFLSTRPGAGGSKLTYIEGWRVIALANEIFGYDGWSSETKSIEVDFVDQTSEGRFNVGVSATVKISLRNGGSHEDVGYGKLENSRSKADALDKCKKEAVTDALKRTLRTFGNLMGNCLYDKTYLNNVKTMQAQKEKFMPSKLYRPDHVTNTSRLSNIQAETKSFKETVSTSEEEEKVIQKPTTTTTTTTTRPAPAPLLNKPSPQTLASKQPTTAQFVSKPSATRHFPSKPAVAPPPRPILLHTEAEKNKNTRISPPVPVPQLTTSKRKFQEEEAAVGKQREEDEEEEDEEEEDEPTMNEEEEEGEETSLAPPPATLSDKYFEFDEAELAELAQAESSCGIGGKGGGGSPDESGLITDTSLVTTDGDTTTSNTTILGDDRHLPSKGAVQPKPLSSNPTRPPPPPARLGNNGVGKVASAGQLPAIKSNVPSVQSSIRYPSGPHPPRKPSLLNPQPHQLQLQQHKHPQQLYHHQHQVNRTVKKVRTSND